MKQVIRGIENKSALQHPRFKWRVVKKGGKPLIVPTKNPILDTRQYEVKLVDGRIGVIILNIIADNLLNQVDSELHCQIF